MVFQSNFTGYLINELLSKSYSVDFGDSANVNYEDNALDNTYFTKSTDIEVSNVNDTIKYSFTLEDTEGNGHTYDALLLNVESNEMNKILFNDIDKDSNTAIEITFNLVFHPK
jgi:hypothetical protein